MASSLSDVRDRWIRYALIGGLGLGFTIPYFRIFNRLEVEGDELIDSLPHKGVVFLSNHQTYFMEAMAFFDVVYVKHHLPLEDPFMRFSAAEETMQKNFVTELFTRAGGVTFKRSFREGGKAVRRPVDLAGVARLEEAIAAGWLLHFPAGTTQKGAPLRSGVAQLLHRTKAIAVPVHVEGFRALLLHKQLPGKIGKTCRIRIFPPLDLTRFYERAYHKEDGQKVVAQLTELLKEQG